MPEFNLGSQVYMDTDPLERSAHSVEKALTGINKSLRSQRKHFKQNEASADDLAKHEELLTTAIKYQEAQLKNKKDELAKQTVAMKNSNKVTDEQRNKVQNASAAVQRAENQLSDYKKSLQETGIEQKLLGRSTSEVKNSLGDLKNQAKLSQIQFEKSVKSIDDYRSHLAAANHNIQKHDANLKLLKGNLSEVSRAHGANSKAANKLRNDIAKEAIAFQVAQGRVDELTDELKALQRQQTLMGKFKGLGQSFSATFSEMSQKINKIGDNFRNLGYVATGVLRGGLLANSTALIPVLGSVISLTAGLGGAITALGGGVIGLGGAYGIAMGSAMAFAGQATTALQMLEEGTLKTTAETQRYQSALSALKSQWEGLVQSNQASIFNTMANGINIAQISLTKLSPAITTTTNQMEDASVSMKQWVTSSENAKNAFQLLNSIVPKIFGNVLNSGRNATDGLTHMFTQFGPLFTWVGQGIENVSKKFQKWANSTSTDNGISQFIQYTKTNLPIVLNIFGNVFKGIFNLFNAFSGHSHTVLVGIQKVTESFKNWSNEMKNSDGFKQFINYLETNGPKVWDVIKNITQTLWGLAKGMAPVGAVMLDLIKRFTAWTSEMTNAHPVIGKTAGVLTVLVGGLMAIVPPLLILGGSFTRIKKIVTGFQIALGGARTALGLFGKEGKATLGVQKLWNGVTATGKAIADGYRYAIARLSTSQVIATAKTKIASAATKAWTVITKGATLAAKGLGLAIKFMTGPVGLIITAIGAFVAIIIHLWKTNDTFRNNVIKIWNAVKSGVMKSVNFIKDGVPKAFNFIKTKSIAIWNGLKTAVVTIVKVWWTIVKAYFNTWKTVITTIWNTIKKASITVWNAIKKGVVSIVKALVNGVKSYINGVKKIVSTVFNTAKKISINIWTAIKNGIVKIAKSLWSGVKATFNALKKGVTSIFNTVKNVSVKVWTTIKNKVVNFAKLLWRGLKIEFNLLKKGVTIIFNAVKNTSIKVWTTIKNKVISFAKSLWSGVRNTFNSLKKGVSSVFNSVKNNAIKAWNTIKSRLTGIASSIWSSVKKTFNNMKDGLKGIIDKIKGFIGGMVDSVKKGLNKLISGVNWVAGKIGMKKLPKFKFHTGTESTHTQNIVQNGKLTQDTMATVGDKGKGNGPNGFRHETIIYPNGKEVITPDTDTDAYIPKGSKILNGEQTYQRHFQPQFSTGTLFGSGGSSGKKKNKGLFDGLGESIGNGWSQAKESVSRAWEGAKSAGKKASKMVGDVWKYASDPSKLVDKVLKSFGVNFDFAKGDLLGGLMKGAYKKLKSAVKSLFNGWLEDSGGGDGSSFTKYGSTTPYSPNKPVPGYPSSFNGGRHFGIDYSTPFGTTIKAPNDGTVSKLHDQGGGTVAKLLSGKFTQFFMHLSKVMKTGKVNKGDAFAKTGNSGAWTTGPHLHYQVEKGDSPFVTNKNTVNPEKYLAGNGGGKQSVSAWKTQIRSAAKRMKVSVSDSEVDGIAAQIQRESNGDAGVTQGNIGDINNAKGTPAQGLLQYVPSTFKSYAVKGHSNIKNGYDQLLAFFNNSNWRKNLPYGKSGWGPTGTRRFAKGTNNAPKGFANVFEEGGEIMNLNGGEQIIPNDVSIAALKSTLEGDLFKQTQSAVYEGISQYADAIRERKQQESNERNRRDREYEAMLEQNNKLNQIIEQMSTVISSLFNIEGSNERIANKDFAPVIDPRGMNESNHEQEAINKAVTLLGRK